MSHEWLKLRNIVSAVQPSVETRRTTGAATIYWFRTRGLTSPFDYSDKATDRFLGDTQSFREQSIKDNLQRYTRSG